MYDTEEVRARMVESQVRAWDVLDQRVLGCLASLPREDFVPAPFRHVAYADTQIPLGDGEVMMAPQIEGRLLQALELESGDRVLEVGTGSGYLTACLARLAGSVTSIDIRPDFVAAAGRRLAALGNPAVQVETADIFAMSAEKYDVIAFTGSMPVYDPRFEDWLATGGRLFVIVGTAPLMEARLVRRTGPRDWDRDALFETLIPALRNAPEPPAFVF